MKSSFCLGSSGGGEAASSDLPDLDLVDLVARVDLGAGVSFVDKGYKHRYSFILSSYL